MTFLRAMLAILGVLIVAVFMAGYVAACATPILGAYLVRRARQIEAKAKQVSDPAQADHWAWFRHKASSIRGKQELAEAFNRCQGAA